MSEFEKQEAAVELGVAATYVVHAIGRALRAQSLSEADLGWLKSGRQLLDKLIAPPGEPQATGPQALNGGDSVRVTLDAIKAEVPEGEEADYVNGMREALAAAIRGNPADEQALANARRVFRRMGKSSLNLANGLTQAGPHYSAWLTSAPITPF